MQDIVKMSDKVRHFCRPSSYER